MVFTVLPILDGEQAEVSEDAVYMVHDRRRKCWRLNMEEKMEIIQRMVENGYHLMNRTAEEMASMFTVEDLEAFEQNFNEWRKKQ